MRILSLLSINDISSRYPNQLNSSRQISSMEKTLFIYPEILNPEGRIPFSANQLSSGPEKISIFSLFPFFIFHDDLGRLPAFTDCITRYEVMLYKKRVFLSLLHG
jgi:hypothetical protein